MVPFAVPVLRSPKVVVQRRQPILGAHQPVHGTFEVLTPRDLCVCRRFWENRFPLSDIGYGLEFGVTGVLLLPVF